jgi:phosphohistidine phosphatase
MDLILWRHAEAADGVPDHARELTAKGIKQAAKIAAFLHQHLPREHRILVSPTARTQQTAAALTSHFTLAPTIAPGASAQAVLQAARWPDAGGTVLVVGHQPTLGEVAAHLLGCDDSSLSIKKGAIWWFSQREESEQAALRLVIAPDFL